MSDVFPEGQPEETSAREEREALQAWHKYGKYPYLLAKFAFFGAICVLLFVCLRTVESVAFPLFLSLLTAYLLDPLIDRFEEKNIDRTLAIAIVILLMGLGFVLLVLVLYPLVARQVINVAQKFPTLLDTLQTKVIPWLQSQAGFEMPVNLQTAVTQYGEELKSAAPTIFKKVGDWGTGLLTQTGVIVASLLNLIMIPIFTFYFLRDFDRMKDGAAQFIPLYRRGVVVDRLYKIDDVVGAWFRGQIQVSLILAALYGVGLGTA
ncbi:MAG: AI-2E family transporter, partial [Myxococcota bacterium]|nr:AI-2E family transporter [Myxococcota bacterium]